MAASLIVRFADVPAVSDPNQDAVRSAVQTAFNEWTRHFDYTVGTYTIDVSFRALSQPADASLRYSSPAVFSGS